MERTAQTTLAGHLLARSGFVYSAAGLWSSASKNYKGSSMKIRSALSIIGALLSLVLVSACSQGQGPAGGAAAVDPESPEGRAFLYRQAVMRVAANKSATVGAMARGEVPVDEAAFAKAVNDLNAVSGMTTEGFMPQGAPEGSRALPEIWMNWADFEAKAMALTTATQSLADATRTGGFAAGSPLVQNTVQNCGGCHRTYRMRTEE
jgi:cytochrome c556